MSANPLHRTVAHPPYKPRPGTLINWSHPLARALSVCVLFNEGGGASVWSINKQGSLTGGPAWKDGGLYFDGSDDVAVFAGLPDSLFTGPLTIVWGGKIAQTATYNHFAGKHFDNGISNNPFDFRTNGSTALTLVRSSASLANSFTSSITLDADKFQIYGVICADGLIQTVPTFFIDNLWNPNPSGDGYSGACTGAGADLRIGLRADSAVKMTGTAQFLYIFSRALTRDEARQLVANPYQMFVPPRVWVPTGNTFYQSLAGSMPASSGTIKAGRFKIFLNDTASDINPGANEERKMLLTRGSGFVAYVKNTLAGTVTPPTTATQFTKAGAGTEQIWYSNPLQAVTVSGNVTFNLWAKESAIQANATITAELLRADNDGTNLTVIASCTLSRAELTATILANNWVVTPTSTALTAGQRLAVRVYIDDGNGVTMASGRTVTMDISGTTGAADGDSYVNLTEAIFELVGNQYNQSLSGSMPAASGAMLRLISVKRAGSFPAAAGGILKVTNVGRIGNMPSPSGHAYKGIFKSLTGNMPAPSGILAGTVVFMQAVAGVMGNIYGGIVKRVNKKVSGLMPVITGNIKKGVLKKCAGVLPAFTGNLAKKPAKLLFGYVPAPSGTAVGVSAYMQALAGTFGNIVGGIVKRINKGLSGTLPASTATIKKKVSVRRAGNMPAPSGNVNAEATFLQTLSGIMGAISAILTAVFVPFTEGTAKLIHIIGSAFRKIIGG